MEQDLTARQKIMDAVKGMMLTAKDISKVVGLKEKEVLEHLPHVAKTVNSSKEALSARFVVQPSECVSCGFVFKKRERLKTPSRCPVCRSEEITEMRFGIIDDVKKN
ncbi:MAG: transcriptional regulator [Deltaproteobacteria bacterium]|nr:transcriptional regulator [Deltaproteobacteria bacterium]